MEAALVKYGARYFKNVTFAYHNFVVTVKAISRKPRNGLTRLPASLKALEGPRKRQRDDRADSQSYQGTPQEVRDPFDQLDMDRMKKEEDEDEKNDEEEDE